MGKTFKYSAFISYSHADAKIVAALHRALEGYRLPGHLVGIKTNQGIIPKKLPPFFRDRDDLSASTNLTGSVKTALKQSKFLIVVCSPDAAKSAWVNKEIEAFEKIRGRDHILCMIVGSDDGKAGEYFPAAILKMKARGEYEPIAADAREKGDGKRLAKLKLIAGLLGIELDQLVQRDAARRQVQQLIGLGVSLALVVILSILLAAAIEARKAAEKAQLYAEEKRGQAEELVDFMLGDLKTKLEPIGSLQLMDDIAMQALGYYAAMDVDELDPKTLGRRSEVLLMIGEIEQQRGNLQLARQIYEQAFLTTEELLSQNPENPGRIFDHSQSVFWLAYIDLLQGKFDSAEKQFRLYTDYATQLAEKDPGNEDYKIEVGYAHSNVGTLLFRQGKYSQAETEFLQQLEIFQDLAVQDTDSEDLAYEVGQSLGWLADAEVGLGKLQMAKTHRTSELEIYQGILSENPQNMSIQIDLLVVHNALEIINSYLGDKDAALSNFRTGFEIGEFLLASDAENARYKETFSRLIVTFLEIWGPGRTLDENQNLTEKARNLVTVLYDMDQANTDWALLYFRTLFIEAQNLFKEGRVEAGLEKALQANDAIKTFWKKNQNNLSALTVLGTSALDLARGYSLKGESENGNPALKDFLEVALPRENNLAPRDQDLLARVLWKTGAREKARQKRDFLLEIGYHAPDFESFWKNSGD